MAKRKTSRVKILNPALNEQARKQFQATAEQSELQKRASKQGVPLEAFRPEDMPKRNFQQAVQSLPLAATSLSAEKINERAGLKSELEQSQAEAKLEGTRRQGPETPEERSQAVAQQATEDVINAFIDPLAPLVERGEKAVEASEPGSRLQGFNENTLEVTRQLQAATKKFTTFLYKQIAGRGGLGLGLKKDLQEKYTEATSNKNANIAAMNLLIANLEAGLPIENPIGQFEQYTSNVYQNYQIVRALNQNSLNGYLEDGLDTMEQMETAVNLEIPDMQARFNAALASRV